MTAATTPVPSRPGTYMRRVDGWQDEGWTATPNRLIRDIRVEWDAKAAYGWIASHQQLIFELDAEKLAAAGPRGRNHAYDMLRCLEYWGWLTRSRYRATDGNGTVHIWDLHPKPVDPDDRTWRPSAAERRKGYTAPDGTVVPGTDGPEIPDGREFRSDAGEPAGQTGNPGGPGVPDPGIPGNPTRPGTDRPGFPYKEEKTIEEEQGEGAGGRDERAAAEAAPERDDPPTPDPPRRRADLDDPSSWLCEEHLALRDADPGADIPPCGRCRSVREWCERKVRERAAAAERERLEAADDDANRAAACRWHDAGGFVIDPRTGLVFEPAVPCDHRSGPEAARARAEAARRGADHRPGASDAARQAARELVRSSVRAVAPAPRRGRGGRRARAEAPPVEAPATADAVSA